MEIHCYEQAWQLAQQRHAAWEKGQSFLKVKDLSRQQLRNIVATALQMKQQPQDFSRALQGQKVALLFQKTSTRTRCSFETGIYEMGGLSSWIAWESSNFIRSDLAHEVRTLSRYYDGLMARVNRHSSLETMAENSSIPVINGMSDKEHPCQALSDMMTLCEYFGSDLNGLRLLFIGDAASNVCSSLLAIAPYFDVQTAIAAPLSYRPQQSNAKIFEDPHQAAAWADVIYTDAWVSIGYENETERRLRDLAAFQVNEKLLKSAREHVIFMHCLPAHIDEEVSKEVIEGQHSIVFEQAENRLHCQKALLLFLLQRRTEGR